MGKNTTGLKRGGFTKENAGDMARRAAEKRMQNKAERLCMMQVASERVTKEDREAICDALTQKARNGDERSITLLLQLLGEMPDAKQSIEVSGTSGLCEADRALIAAVAARHSTEIAP